MGQSGFAWIITHKTSQLWHRHGLAPGPAEDIHSGQAEAFGILAALIFIQYYLSCYCPLPEATTMKCFCDNMGVITNITTLQASEINCPNNATNDNHDLIMAINDVVRKCQPLELQFLYIKGHQDTKADQPLTLKEQYNVKCNHLAKLYMTSTTKVSTTMATLEFEAAQPHLCIVGKIICRWFIPALCEHAV